MQPLRRPVRRGARMTSAGTSQAAYAALVERVRALLAQRDFAQAFGLVDAALRAEPKPQWPWRMLRLDVALAAADEREIAATLERLLEATSAAEAPRVVAALRARRHLADAWRLLQRSTPRGPALAAEAYNLGVDFGAAGKRYDARAAYAYALAARPDFAEAALNLGDTWLGEREFLRALPYFDAAARLRPDDSGAWLGLGQCLLNVGRGREALAAFARVGGAFARLPLLSAWRASALAQEGENEAALALYAASLEGDANCYDAVFGRALLLEQRGELAAAARGYAHAWRLRAASNWALGNLVHVLRRMAAWSEMAVPEAELVGRLERGDIADFARQWIDLGLSADTYRRIAEHYGRAQSALRVVAGPPAVYVPDAGERLRVGYVSADFREHATSYLLVGALECHDRRQFEIFGYSLGHNDGSAMRRRVAASCEHFVDAAGWSADRLAARVRDDRIDVLVDLNGHTKGACYGLLALRPAPVIVNYLGYPGTLGAYADYIIGDRYVTPPGSEHEFSEAIVRLPGCYQPNDHRRDTDRATTRLEHGLREDAIVACSFNQVWKFTPATWTVWMRALAAHPRACLWLVEDNPWATANLRRSAEHAGVDPSRVVFAPRLPQAAHLARLALADLALDTAPCNSHTTGSDALWAGVPMLSLQGHSFDGRVGASLLAAVGLSELVTQSLEDYAAKLDALLRAPARLAEFKTMLIERRAISPLFDSAATARALERAYAGMYARFREGLPPAALDVPA